MKRLVFIVLAVTVAAFGSGAAFAHGHHGYRAQADCPNAAVCLCDGSGHGFVDDNGDGICDYYADGGSYRQCRHDGRGCHGGRWA